MNTRTQHLVLTGMIVLVTCQCVPVATSPASVNVPGFAVVASVDAGEPVSYSFFNNLRFSIDSNVSVTLSVVYVPTVASRQVTVIIRNDMPLDVQFRFRPGIEEFLPGMNELPTLGRTKMIPSYGTTMEVVSNRSIQEVWFLVEKDATLGLEPAKQYRFALYSMESGKWQVLDTIERVGGNMSKPTLEGGFQGIEQDHRYYVTLLELDSLQAPPDDWSWAIVVTVMLVLGLAMAISKKAYMEYLKTRNTSIDKGAHRMSVEEVLENENRNAIIELILDEPGIHFNELLRRTGLAPGNLVWHLDVLETYKIIGKQRFTNKVVYFPYHDENPLSNLDLQISKSKITLNILKLIENEPGVWANEITKKMEVNRKTIQYHVKKLEELGVIRTQTAGRKRKIFVNLDSAYYKKA